MAGPVKDVRQRPDGRPCDSVDETRRCIDDTAAVGYSTIAPRAAAGAPCVPPLRRFLPGRRLDDVVGGAFTHRGAALRGRPREQAILPLPHPSGQSRWLNEATRLALLDRALQTLRRLREWTETDA